MHLSRITRLFSQRYSTLSFQTKIPFNNGGTLCIPREHVVSYVNVQSQEGKRSKDEGTKLIPEVEAFKNAVFSDPVLKLCYIGGLDSIPPNGCLHRDPPEQLFDTLNSICTNPPKFHNAKITGVPFYILFIDFLDTRKGQAFFANPIVNIHLKNIFGAYATMLKSKISLKYVVEDS